MSIETGQPQQEPQKTERELFVAKAAVGLQRRAAFLDITIPDHMALKAGEIIASRKVNGQSKGGFRKKRINNSRCIPISPPRWKT